MTPPEEVLCSPRNSLPMSWLPEAGFVPIAESVLFEMLKQHDPVWLPRPRAELDDRFKQWIPYALIQNSKGEFAVYPRRGTEARLHGLWSLGIGGHINPQDAGNGSDSALGAWPRLLWGGLQRELVEEFPDAAPGRTKFLGLINENLSEVGQLHLGAVFLHRPDNYPGQVTRELSGLCWISPRQLGDTEWPLERLELWSRLALQLYQHSLG